MIHIGNTSFTDSQYIIEIKNKNGEVKALYAMGEDAVYRRELMASHCVEISFTLGTFEKFFRGDYIFYEETRFTLRGNALPDEVSKGEYKYKLIFEADEMFLQDVEMYYLRQDYKETNWSLTANAAMFLQIACDNANRYFNTDAWQIGTVEPSSIEYLSFDNKSVWDALVEIAQAFQAEFFFEDGIISLVYKLEYAEPVELETEVSIDKLSASKGDSLPPYNRLAVFGSTRNIPANYRETENGEALDAIYQKRLRLPQHTGGVIDLVPDLSPNEILEGTIIFEEVYPKTEGNISAIEVKEYTDTNTTTGEATTWNAYRFKDNGLQFSETYVLPGTELRIKFESGLLSGLDFAVKFNPGNEDESRPAAQLFEIIRNEDYGIPLPNDTLKPQEGNKYILYGYDASLLSSAWITAAENELLEKGIEWGTENLKDKAVYECESIPGYFQENSLELELGQRVRLKDIQWEEGFRDSRIQAIEKKLLYPYNCKYTIGDNPVYSFRSSLEKQIEELKMSAYLIGKGVYLIRSKHDTTQPTEYNTYSSVAIDNRSLSRLHDDVASGMLTLSKGANFGEYAGGLTGFGGRIDERGAAEFDSLSLRRFLEVPELRYNRVDVITGDKWRASGGGLIESVDTENHIITLKLEEGEIGTVDKGDICMGIFHSHKPEENAGADSDDSKGNRTFAGFYTCYFTITETLDTEKTKFRYQLRPASENYPNPMHPSAAMHFVGYGSFTNTERQASCYETRTYQRYLVNVDGWEFERRNIAAQFGDLSNLSVHGLNMTGYSAYLNNIYMTGVIDQISADGESVNRIPFNKGEWKAGIQYAYYDYVTYTGSLWLCVNPDGTQNTPSVSNPDWFLWVEKGKDGEDGEPGIIPAGRWTGAHIPYEKGSVVTFARATFLAKRDTSLPPVALLTSEGSYLTTGGYYILRGNIEDFINEEDWQMLTPPPEDGMDGKDGKDGIDGTDYEYIFTRTREGEGNPATPLSEDTDDYVPAGWTDDPSGVNPEYIYEWVSQRTKDEGRWGHFSKPALWARYAFDGQPGLQGIQGEKGEQGIPGTNGADGRASYFHIKYAAVENPTGSDLTEIPNTFIGTYVDDKKEDSTDPAMYTWYRFQGLQGDKGEQGIPGINGENGETYYLHIKYSNDGGKTFTGNNGEDPGDYIGILIDLHAGDSPNVEDYTWSKTKGEPGETGIKPAGRWQTSGTPYEERSLVTFARATFLAKKTTSVPPVALLMSGSNYVTSGGYYLLRGELEKYINQEDWELITPPPVDGENGQDGKDGADGQDGTNGKDGEKGDKGETGLQGQIVRTSEWAAGVEYRNDTEETGEIRFLDVVVISENNSQRIFQCKKTHTSSASMMPPNTTYWEVFNNTQPIYTPLLLAENAVIKFAQNQQLLIQDTAGNVVAGLSGKGEIPIWSGNKEPSEANFYVDRKGKLTANEVSIKGHIEATSGKFSGELNGVTGSFQRLVNLNEEKIETGRISFNDESGISIDSDASVTIGTDLHAQGVKNNRSLRFYASNIRCRGAFGAYTRNTLVVYGYYAYYFYNGLGSSGSQYISLSYNTFNKISYYTIPLYGGSNTGEASGFPVDVVIIYPESNSVAYNYALESIVGKKVTVISANDKNNNMAIVANGKRIVFNGGAASEWINIKGYMSPDPGNAIGNGWLRISYFDNNW